MQIDTEKEVLGDALISAEAHARVRAELSVDDFTERKHQQIFSAMCSIYDEGKSLDPVILMNELGNKLQEVGGVPYITELSLNAITPANVGYHIDILRSASRKRHFAIDIKAIYKAMQEDADDYLDRAEDAIAKARSKSAVKVEMVSEYAVDVYRELFEGRKRGLETGFLFLDHMMGGLYRGHVCVIAGRPSMGKTSFAANIAANMAQKGKGVVFFSLEQPKVDIAKRILVSLSQCSEYDVMHNSPKVEQLVEKLDTMAQWKMSIIDDAYKIEQIREKCYAFRRQTKSLDLVVVDYLGLVKTNRRNNREQEIAELSRTFKLLARELNCPIILLSQLNRESERRTTHKPALSDLRDSGAIEQDADQVLFLYRPAVYDSSANGKEAAVIVAKNRNGRTGEIDVEWHGEYFTYRDSEEYEWNE